MTNLIKGSLSGTKMQLHNTLPQTWQQIQNNFNLEHLPLSQKHDTLQMLGHHQESFAKHNLDLGCTDLMKQQLGPTPPSHE
jgi:hypothetical protein